MEEADALCSNIGILVRGGMRLVKQVYCTVPGLLWEWTQKPPDVVSNVVIMIVLATLIT